MTIINFLTRFVRSMKPFPEECFALLAPMNDELWPPQRFVP